MNPLESLLVKLENLMIEKCVPSISYFKEGHKRTFIANSFEHNQINCVEEIIDLYSWHNGIDCFAEITQRRFQLCPYIYFEPMEVSLIVHAEMCKNLSLSRLNSMFPLFTDGGGIYYLIDLDSGSPEFKMIIEMNPSSNEFDMFISKYDSLESFINSTIQCYQNNAYFLNTNDSTLDVKYELEFETHRMINPKSKYWILYS